MKNQWTPLKIAFAGLLPAVLLTGCPSSSNNSPAESTTQEYRVTLTNVSHNQPLSPLAVILHKTGYEAWGFGLSASVGIEKLAESGDNSDLLSAASADGNVVTTKSGAGLILPGGEESLDISFDTTAGLRLTLATMLVNTNDAFSGVSAQDLSQMQLHDVIRLQGLTYDAGTEGNSETAATVPGPASAGAGEGFNTTRDDTDFVSIHAGVVTLDDGLASSVLNESHRWDGAASLIKIERIK